MSIYRTAILDAATAEFAERGYGATKISDIAERAGMSVGAVYRHFTSKDEIFLSLIEVGVGDLTARLRSARERPGKAFQRLEAMLATHFAMLEERHWMLLVFQELMYADRSTSERLVRVSSEARTLVVAPYAQTLAAARKSGEVSTDLTAADQLSFLLGAIHGFCEAWQRGGFAEPLVPKAAVIVRLVARALGGAS